MRCNINNVVYFPLFDSAYRFFNRLFPLDTLYKSGIGPVISENQARYKRPVTFPDTPISEVSALAIFTAIDLPCIIRLLVNSSRQVTTFRYFRSR